MPQTWILKFVPDKGAYNSLSKEWWDFSQLRIYRPPPFRSGHIYMKDAHSAESNKKSIFRFFLFLFVYLRTILYSKFIKSWPILNPKTAISQKLKIGKLVFHSYQHILHLSCKFGYFWEKKTICPWIFIILLKRNSVGSLSIEDNSVYRFLQREEGARILKSIFSFIISLLTPPRLYLHW